ncbi:S8 family serine peptidase [Marinithermus hydrothermalis]|uniref:Peptidase S8 and S53 subtilisin kexin sedolisin n=1 Tax=Marinithermus hydrothermalis (strain DSM 14884 / JCM 11576 / T1) TaxID=869210 RepID=F2NPN2_MARHT|nr:S8 family serine peptidase [Marinithermus hydrothermalis]AEB12533.1 peptidase S8 and S53 subtilisin kexin sedolisin [Marinithermus hydrothermalis DSM 14884]
MPRWVLVLLALALAACRNGTVPEGTTLSPEGTGRFGMTAPANAVWQLVPDPNAPAFLQLTPNRGIGPAVVQVTASPTPFLPDQAVVEARVAVSGDLNGVIRVRWPLVRVTGTLYPPPLEAARNASFPARGLFTPEAAAPVREVLVKYRSSPARPLALTASARVLAHDPQHRLLRLEAPDPQALLERLAADPAVEWAEPNARVYALSVAGEPMDAFYPLQWHLRRTGARWAHLATYPVPVTVAVIDTGVRFDHPDLSGRVWGPGEGALDLVEGDTDPTDPFDNLKPEAGSHGTHVTGLIAASAGPFPPACPTCTNSGTVGLAWPAPVKVLPIRVLDTRGSGTVAAVAAAIRYAAGLPITWDGVTYTNPHPAQVINLSLGTTAFSHAMCEAVREATARGVAVVAAAGNGAASNLVYPASCDGAISVAATDYNFGGAPRRAWYSEFNDAVDVSAPGGDVSVDSDRDGYPDGILSTTWNYVEGRPNYAFYMGTSQATPQVAGALALLIASGRAATGQAAWAALQPHLTDLGDPGPDPAFGYGFLNLPPALGVTPPPGPFRVTLTGPTTRHLVPDADGRFVTHLPPGRYALTACRDDSANGLCDPGEPALEQSLEVPGDALEQDLGALSLTPP